jgi:phosphoribosylformylglycinamidine cyclo-ligase
VALVDYLALQRADAALVRSVAKGLAQGARQASVAIVGGETAIMGDVVKGIDGKGFDLAAMAVGVVDKNQMLEGSRIRAGDVVVGAASSGIHANGLTLARKVLLKDHTVEEYVPELGRTLGQELLEPTAIYVRPALKALQECEIHGLAHITGGAFAKLARLVGSRRLRVALNRMPVPRPIFDLIQRSGRVSDAEMYRVFNMGVGLCVFSPRHEVERIGRIFRTHGFPTFEVGHIQRGEGIVLGGTPIA